MKDFIHRNGHRGLKAEGRKGSGAPTVMQRPTIGRTATMDRETKQALLKAADMQGLSAEFLEVLADAERYRWLRERHEVLCRMYTAQGLGLDLSAVYVQTAEQLDGVIDAAMAPRQVLGGA